MSEEKKPETDEQKIMRISQEIGDILAKEGAGLVTNVSMSGGSMNAQINVVLKPQESKIAK